MQSNDFQGKRAMMTINYLIHSPSLICWLASFPWWCPFLFSSALSPLGDAATSSPASRDTHIMLFIAPIMLYQHKANYDHCFTPIMLSLYSIVQVSTHHKPVFITVYDSFSYTFLCSGQTSYNYTRLDCSLNASCTHEYCTPLQLITWLPHVYIHYASIMLAYQNCVLCPKQCQHIMLVPTCK